MTSSRNPPFSSITLNVKPASSLLHLMMKITFPSQSSFPTFVDVRQDGQILNGCPTYTKSPCSFQSRHMSYSTGSLHKASVAIQHPRHGPLTPYCSNRYQGWPVILRCLKWMRPQSHFSIHLVSSTMILPLILNKIWQFMSAGPPMEGVLLSGSDSSLIMHLTHWLYMRRSTLTS